MSSYWYLATPYSKYPGGHDAAFREACKQTALLMRHGIRVFSPIAHSHPVALHGELNNMDHCFWLGHDEVMMRGAVGMIECRMEGWAQSYGMQWERQWFERAGRPIVAMTPGQVPALEVAA